MYSDTSLTETAVGLLVEEQDYVAVVKQNLDLMRIKVSDYKIQLDGLNSSLAVHESTRKQAEALVKFLNTSLADKQDMVMSLNVSTKQLIQNVTELRKKVSNGENSLKKVLETQTDAFLTIENVREEKEQLEQQWEVQKKIVDEARVDENGLGFFEKFRKRRQVSAFKGELDKLVSRIKTKQTTEWEINEELNKLKATRTNLDKEVQNNRLLITTTEKHILDNGVMLKTHQTEVERVSAELHEAEKRCFIENDKVKNLRRKIGQKRNDIASCSGALERLGCMLIKRQAQVVDIRKRQEEVSDKVTLAIAEDS